MMPMVHGLLSKWAPPQERARFNTYILGGIYSILLKLYYLPQFWVENTKYKLKIFNDSELN